MLCVGQEIRRCVELVSNKVGPWSIVDHLFVVFVEIKSFVVLFIDVEMLLLKKSRAFVVPQYIYNQYRLCLIIVTAQPKT